MQLLLDRRRFLSLATLGGLTSRAAGSHIPGFGRAKSVLIVMTPGGMSQLETWDPKPNAPAEVRGAFGTIPTRTSGVRFGEHLPRVASLSDHFAVIRSMTHDDTDHGSATYLAMTGVFHKQKSSNPPVSPKDHPTYGAALKRVRPHREFPHTSVHINGPLFVPLVPAPGQNGGFLGRQFEPLALGDVTEPSALLEGLEPTSELPSVRLHSRQSLLSQLDGLSQESESAPQRDRRQLSEQAFELLRSPQHRHAFDLEREPERVRDRYGRYRGGQACLLARRLIEAGVPLVTVYFNHNIRGQDESDATDEYGWDTHNDIFDSLKDRLLPRFDWSFSALLEDLHQRGLLETTLVVCMGEFGRAPLVAMEKNFAGSSPGRKHWAACYSICLAGAGVVGGKVLGSSDRLAAYPQSDPTTPGDVAATIFSALGVDPSRHFEDGVGRTFPLTTGRAIEGVYS